MPPWSRERRQRHEERKILAAAYHEAGHATVALLLGHPVQSVQVRAWKIDGMRQLDGHGSEVIEEGECRVEAWGVPDQDRAALLLGAVVVEDLDPGRTLLRPRLRRRSFGAEHDMRDAHRVLNHDQAELQAAHSRARTIILSEIGSTLLRSIAEELVRKDYPMLTERDLDRLVRHANGLPAAQIERLTLLRLLRLRAHQLARN